jgi:hypothetical protein
MAGLSVDRLMLLRLRLRGDMIRRCVTVWAAIMARPCSPS